MNKDIEQI